MSLIFNTVQDATSFSFHQEDYNKQIAGDMLMAATSEQDPAEVRDEQGTTALHHASLLGNSDLISLLVDAGADTETREEANDSTSSSLHFAASHNKLDMVTLLLDKGADIEERDGNGRTPLFLACEGGHLNMVQLLLNEGADINASDEDDDKDDD